MQASRRSFSVILRRPGLIPRILPLDVRNLAAPAAAHRVPAVFVEKGLDQIAATRAALIGRTEVSKLFLEFLEVLQGLLQELHVVLIHACFSSSSIECHRRAFSR